MIKNLYFLNEILHQVWKSRHRNCINLSNGSELTVQWQSPRTFYHYITRINTISMAWFAKHWKFKHFKKFMKIQKNSPNFHCIEFFKFNTMEIAWIFLGFPQVFWWMVIFMGIMLEKLIYLIWNAWNLMILHTKKSIVLLWFDTKINSIYNKYVFFL